jgi:cold shock CspA family protein
MWQSVTIIRTRHSTGSFCLSAKVKVKILISAQRLTGTIKWYNHKKGFGFLTPDSGGRDVFIHRSALGRELQAHIESGDRVVFGVEQRKKGPSALNVKPLDEAREDRARHDGRVSETRQPAASGTSFADLNLMPELRRAVDAVGYVEPTPVQAQAIPPILAGRDLLGCAQTGTGKTAAFALPILQRLSTHANGHRSKRPVRALVLAPTRELAIQIDDSFRTYGQFTGLTMVVIYGGVGQGPQVDALRRGVDIVVATPGRLLDLMGQGHVRLDHVEALVLDEADRMLDMGFIHDAVRPPDAAFLGHDTERDRRAGEQHPAERRRGVGHARSAHGRCHRAGRLPRAKK